MSYPEFRSDWELLLGVRLWQVVSPILIILGTIGSILSIVVMSKKRFLTMSATYYLIGLALSDIIFLYTVLFTEWMRYTFGIALELLSDAACKMYWWLGYFSGELPIWMQVTITIERLIATVIPHKSKRISTPKVAKIVLLVLPVTILITNLHFAIGFGRKESSYNTTETMASCEPLTKDYGEFFNNAWVWIEVFKFTSLLAVLTIGNGCIVWKLFVSERKSRSRIGPTQQAPTAAKNDSNRRTTILLLCLNAVFIICNCPICIYVIGKPYWVQEGIPVEVQLQDPWWAVVNLFMYLNNSINFSLYCLSGSKFRNELKRMFTRNQVQPFAG